MMSMAKLVELYTANYKIQPTFTLLFSACAKSIQGNEGNTIIVTPANKGNSAVLNVGDTLEIQIPTIPSEGFEWQTRNLNNAILAQEGAPIYVADTSPNSAGGITTLRFLAVGKGKTDLTLIYTQSSSGKTNPFFKHSLGMAVEVK